jgi:hypothetical protein
VARRRHWQGVVALLDFESRTFAHRNSGKLFARKGINSAATEAYLNKYIETPFAIVQDKIVAAGADLRKVEAAFAELSHTALTGLYWLQVQRLRDAKHSRTEHHLDEFVRKGFTWLEGLSAVVFEKFEPLLYAVRTVLYFPDSAIFLIPLADQMPAIALPIHTGLALVFADKTTNRKALDGWLANDWMPTAFSLGLNAQRVVVPPELPNPKPESLIHARAKVRELFHLTSEAGVVAGMPVWRLDDP